MAYFFTLLIEYKWVIIGGIIAVLIFMLGQCSASDGSKEWKKEKKEIHGKLIVICKRRR